MFALAIAVFDADVVVATLHLQQAHQSSAAQLLLEVLDQSVDDLAVVLQVAFQLVYLQLVLGYRLLSLMKGTSMF